MPNKSPLRYPGGKTRACKKLDEILCQYFSPAQIDTIVSPFFGGGSFEFYLQNKYNANIVANDKFQPLFNFWNMCKYNSEVLCEKLYEVRKGFTQEKDYESIKNILKKYRQEIIKQEVSNKILLAVYYFVINRCSFSGATLSGGFSKSAVASRFTKSSIDRVVSLDLKRFNIECCDFEPFIKSYEVANSIMFLDPPYYLKKKSKLYGTNGDMHESFDHKKLAIVLSTRNQWIMTYNDVPFIRDLYKDCIIIATDWSYGMCNVKKQGEKSSKQKKSSEIVIIKVAP